MQSYLKRIEKIESTFEQNYTVLTKRRFSFGSGSAVIFYIKPLTDTKALSEQVISPIITHIDQIVKFTPDSVMAVISSGECALESDESTIEQSLLDGMTVILFSAFPQFIVVNVKNVERRAVSEPEFTYTMRGPRDSFIENIETNLSLIRARIKDKSLSEIKMNVGIRTKTVVSVLYLNDVASEICVNEIIKRISRIDVDGICSSGEMQTFLQNGTNTLFPQTGLVERPDMACHSLLKGKVIVLVDGSPWALSAPKVFSEFLWSGDDIYTNKVFSVFLRLIKIISLTLSFIVSSMYVAVVSFHNDVMPSSYMIAIAESRATVPFSAFIEVFLIEIIGELIRESLIRIPSKIGTAIGIVGAIIIGQAAVTAGIFSPLILIVISLTLISSFVPADFSIVDPFRVLKFLLILASGTFGFLGFTLVIVLILSHLVSLNTFGAPYMAPVAPFNWRDFIKSIMFSKPMAQQRPSYLRTKDKTSAPKRGARRDTT